VSEIRWAVVLSDDKAFAEVVPLNETPLFVGNAELVVQAKLSSFYSALAVRFLVLLAGERNLHWVPFANWFGLTFRRRQVLWLRVDEHPNADENLARSRPGTPVLDPAVARSSGSSEYRPRPLDYARFRWRRKERRTPGAGPRSTRAHVTSPRSGSTR
jgi:hypothetical protein